MKHILDALRRCLLDRGPLAALPEEVWKRTSALNTWGTNALEGNTLGYGEVQRLLLQEQVAAASPARDVLETIQHDRAFRSLSARLDAPITARLSLSLHEDVFRNVKPHAGTWRVVRVGIAGTTYVPPRAQEVPLLLEQWQADYHQRKARGDDALALAAWMHHRFEAVHPFLDGNGRVGRLLLNLHLLQHNWPPAHVTPHDREPYVAALTAGHAGNLGPMESLLAQALARSVLDLLDQVGGADDELRPLAELARSAPYDAKYLSLRASQAALPALKQGGQWRTSSRAVRLYQETTGRK